MDWELEFLNFIQENLRCGWLDWLVPRVSALGNGGALWILLAAGLLVCRKTRRVGLAVAVALLVEALLCNVLLKPLVARVRPCDVNAAVQLLIARPQDFAFPSGHTGAGFAVAAALLAKRSPLGWPTLVLAAIIGLTRLYLYVHWPTDVLAGALLGLFSGWLSNSITKNA